MIWVLLVVGAGQYASVAHAQTTHCGDDTSCNTGFYCESFLCRQCLSCEDLNREPPAFFSPCIKSVGDCGACIKGLVEDRRGDVSLVCVPPAEGEGAARAPAYVWGAVVLGLLLLLVLVVVIVYLLRNTYTFKILASTRTSVESPCARGAGAAASAPDMPPPYDAPSPAPYNPHLAAPAGGPDTPARDDDSSWPFIKRVPSQRGAGAREAPGRQAARVFNNPRYVRTPHLPTSYKSPTMNDESGSTFTVHDEDTMESTWTPTPSADHTDHTNHSDHTDTNGNAVSGGALGPLAVAAPLAAHALAPHASHEPHAFCARQDTNNNRNLSESNGESSGGAAAAPSFIINVVQNINAVQQHNDVTL